MLDLSTAEIGQWFVSNEPYAPIPRAEISMDDLPSVVVALTRLSGALNRCAAENRKALADLLLRPAVLAGFQTVLAHLNPARRLRLFSWLSQDGTPDRIDILEALWGDTATALQPNPGRLVRQSLQHMHRAACLNRLFAPDRLQHLQTLCGAEK